MSISDKWMRKVINNDCIEEIKTYTFCGAYELCYKEITCYWNRDTKKKNESSYENIILPALKDHNNKPISQYEKIDYEEAIRVIKKTGYYVKGVKYYYSKSVIKNFEKLIYYVVFFASFRNLCKNVLWGSNFELEVSSQEEQIREKVKLKKSLTPKQEKKLVKILLEDPNQPGEQVGVLLMLGLGTRNAEACGLNYGDIKKLRLYPDDTVAWIYKTTIPHTAVLQSSGKTWNSGRIVPVPMLIVEYLNQRRKLLEEYLLNNNWKESMDIDELPITCKGYMTEKMNFETRATAQNVTDAARELFNEIEMESKQLAFIEREIQENKLSDVVNEKDATAYLLRRNYATHLQILGLNISEIQYLIGHNVEDAYESRNDFVDEERIHKLALALKNRPLLNEPNDEKDSLIIDLSKGEEVRVNIRGNEPLDTMKVVVEAKEKNEGIRGTYYSESYFREYSRSIDIIEQYHRSYSSKK